MFTTRMTRTLPAALTALFALVALSACETMEGFGQDVETAGETIQEESNEAQANP